MITWRPMTEHPKEPASAMIRATDHECAHLLPGPVTWSIAQDCWVGESSDLPIAMTQPGAVYEWCDEAEIVGAGGTANKAATAIADEAMLSLLECHTQRADEFGHVRTLCGDQGETVSRLDQADAAIQDAVAWLAPRGLVHVVDEPDGGQVIVMAVAP